MNFLTFFSSANKKSAIFKQHILLISMKTWDLWLRDIQEVERMAIIPNHTVICSLASALVTDLIIGQNSICNLREKYILLPVNYNTPECFTFHSIFLLMYTFSQ